MIEKLLPGLWRVGGRCWNGRNAALTPDGGNSYLLSPAGTGKAALIDCGYMSCKQAIEANIRQAGVRCEDLSDLLLTHSHFDHAEAAGQWRKDYGLSVGISQVAAEHLANGDLRLTGVHAHDPKTRWQPFAVDHPLADGAPMEAAGLACTPYAMPGHTPDSMLLTVELEGGKVGFCGDITFGRNGLGQLGNVGWLCMLWKSDLRDYRRSLKRLAGMRFDLLLPGHGDPLVGQAAAGQAIAASLATVEHLLADPATRNFGMEID